MIKTVVARAKWDREIIKVTSYGQVSYLIKCGNQYVGKTKNGGYKTLSAAMNHANDRL